MLPPNHDSQGLTSAGGGGYGIDGRKMLGEDVPGVAEASRVEQASGGGADPDSYRGLARHVASPEKRYVSAERCFGNAKSIA